MNERPKAAEQPGLTPADIYYVLFRHKWKIILCSVLGILGAGGLYFLYPVPYQSEAKLFIRYVQETKAPTEVTGNDPRIKMTDDRGENVVNSELETLTSLDVARRVATNPTNTMHLSTMLGRPISTNAQDIIEAEGVIHQNLQAEVSKKSSVIRVVFSHKDPIVVQPILSSYIQAYLQQHAFIHGAPGMFDDFYQTQADNLREDLRKTEAQLRSAKTNAGIVSIEATEKGLTEQTAKVKQELLDAEAEYAERSVSLSELKKLMPFGAELGMNGAGLTSTNNSAAAGTNSAQATMRQVPHKKVSEYKSLVKQLDDLNQKHQNLLGTFTSETKIVKAVADQIEEREKKKEQLEEEYPELLSMNVVAETKVAAQDPLLARKLEIIAEAAKVKALEVKVDKLKEQLAGLRTNATEVVTIESSVVDLERTQKLKEQQYLLAQSNLDRSKAEKDSEASRVSNISVVQNPSPSAQDRVKLKKAAALVLVAFVALGFGLAFLTEFYLDPSCRRPLEIESRVGVPLFLSIPRTKLNGASLLAGRATALLAEENGHGANGTDAGSRDAAMHVAPWDPRHLLQPYYEALRDRLIAFFDARNLTHKPKLVAVTSCADGAGVTTVAAGLAASLSETGDGNVLLVDMNQEHGSTHQFYKGDLACALDDALELEKRESAMVADNLYVVAEGGAHDKLPRALPKRFKSLVPKLRASDYDYIIFDMPPVSQISVTPRLARFMDMVLMVVESERTDRELVKRATSLMGESKANVGIVLNKGRSYVPKRLLQDL